MTTSLTMQMQARRRRVAGRKKGDNRGRQQIMADMIGIMLNDGGAKTRLMFLANLSFTQIQRHTKHLMAIGFVTREIRDNKKADSEYRSKPCIFFKPTDAGIAWYRAQLEADRMLREAENKRSKEEKEQ